MTYVKIALVALSLALDVFAVCVGVGMRPMARAAKVRIGAAFVGAEVMMNLIGAGLGMIFGHVLGQAAGYFGFAALVGLGIYMIFESRGGPASRERFDLSRGWGLLIGALSISLDSLGIGFSILFLGVPLVTALAFIASASLIATVTGLTLGRYLGTRAEERAAFWAGVILTLTGLAFSAQKFFNL